MEQTVIAPNGATFVCDSEERLQRYLNDGWVIKPADKPERRRKTKEE